MNNAILIIASYIITFQLGRMLGAIEFKKIVSKTIEDWMKNQPAGKP
jgi:hypothetical protein